MSTPFAKQSQSRNFFLLFCLFLIVLSSGSQFVAIGQSRQLSLADIIIALRSKKADAPEKNKILAEAVKARGITFTLTPEIEKELGSTGAYPDLLTAIRERSTLVKVEPVAQPKVEPLLIASTSAKPVPAPPNFDYYWNRAKSFIEKGEMEPALADLDRAIDLRPGDAASRAARGSLLLKQAKYEAAIIDLDTSIKVEPSSAVYADRGNANEKLGRSDAAIADYQKATVLDPQNAAAKSSLDRLVAEKEKAAAKPAIESAKAEPVSRQVTGPVQMGALNIFASKLATPVFTESDRRLGFQGKVTVYISLDETGNVVSIEAKTGPKNLRVLAEDAIKRSKFNPIMVEGKPVKAEGTITFNFIAK